MYTESGNSISLFLSLILVGLAKIAVGVRLEGVNIQAVNRTYHYTTFNRGEPEIPNFNQDFTL